MTLERRETCEFTVKMHKGLSGRRMCNFTIHNKATGERCGSMSIAIKDLINLEDVPMERRKYIPQSALPRYMKFLMDQEK